MNPQEKKVLDEIKDRVQLLQTLPKEMTQGTPDERMAMTKEFWTKVGILINFDTPLLLTSLMEKEAHKSVLYEEIDKLKEQIQGMEDKKVISPYDPSEL